MDWEKNLGNYVRLSFTKDHPMMYVAKNEGRITDPIILEINLSIANLAETLFSDRNATKREVRIIPGLGGAQNIHFPTVLQPNQFCVPDEEKAFYQAEVLVLEKIPLELITIPNCSTSTYEPVSVETTTYPWDTTEAPLFYIPADSYEPQSQSSNCSPHTPSPSRTSSNNPSSGSRYVWISIIVTVIIIIAAAF